MRKPLYFVVALCTAMLLFVAPAPSRADAVSGEIPVGFSSSIASSLNGLGLSISPLGKASFDDTTLTLLLPISSGTLGASGDIFNFAGSGFSVSNGSLDVTFRNLVFNTATSTLSGNMHFGNTQINQVTIFDIRNGGVLTLDAKAAADLSTALGMANLAGTNVGTASISSPFTPGSSGGSSGSATGVPGSGGVSPSPEPSARSLLVASVLAFGALALCRRTRSRLRHA
jgi:hypothetical protein